MPSRLPLLLFLLATACTGRDVAGNHAEADDALANASSDPALNRALRAPLMTDPDLRADANIFAVRPAERPVEGGVPPLGTGARTGSQPMDMPAAGPLKDSGEAPRTLAAMARTVALPCAATLDYALVWADRLPAPFALYPGANLLEAAGNGRSGCNLRVARFVAPASVETVIAHYHQRADRAGFAPEYRADGDVHLLLGRRGDGARFRLRATSRRGGGTDIDLATG